MTLKQYIKDTLPTKILSKDNIYTITIHYDNSRVMYYELYKLNSLEFRGSKLYDLLSYIGNRKIIFNLGEN